VKGFGLGEELQPMTSMRMFIVDISDAPDVVEYVQSLEGCNEDFLEGCYRFSEHAVQIKDPNQPEDYNLGWFVFERIGWSFDNHWMFGEVFRDAVVSVLLCLNRMGILLPNEIKLFIFYFLAELDCDEMELVGFVWDPYYGSFEAYNGKKAKFGDGVFAKIYPPEFNYQTGYN